MRDIALSTRRDFFSAARSPVYATHGAVATSHPLASAEALAVLRAGGSAADAAIAAVAVQCVVEPQMTGIGGDCFALVKTPNAVPLALNGSGHCAAAAPDWLAKKGITEITPTSPLAVTVPGAVAAWHQLHRRYGRLPWRGLFQSAVRYAEHGYPVFPRVAEDWRRHQERLTHDAETADVFLPGGKPPAAGDRHRQPALANSLKQIAADGGESFYRGDIANRIVDKLQRLGAPHSAEDFADYQARWEDAIFGHFRQWTVWQCPPNGQGVIALLMLALLEQQAPRSFDGERLRRFAEINRYAYRWRDACLGDINADWHAAVSHAVAQAPLPPPPAATPPPHKDTVYLAVIDGGGTAVSLINSLFHPFGSGITVGDCGILLQNRGLSFSLQAGHPNAIAPRKRPMHTIIPAIAEGTQGETLAFGVMGGHYQAAGHAWFLSRLLDDGDDLQAALDAPRLFNYPETLEVEPTMPAALRSALAESGYSVTLCAEPLGGGQAVLRRADGLLVAASDCRKDGVALGF